MIPGNVPVGLYTFQQNAGKGQANHTWESKPGLNLAFSLLLPLPENINPVLCNMAVTLGVRQAIENLQPEPVLIKWPNDLLISDIKICGLLIGIQSLPKKGRYLDAGIGINVNQTDWDPGLKAAGMRTFINNDFNLLDVLHEVIICIMHYFNDLNIFKTNTILDTFNSYLWKKGEIVSLTRANHTGTSMRFEGVDAEGRALFQTDGGSVAFHHGEVRLLR